MINYILIIPVIFSFLISLFIIPFWIKKSREIRLVWPDMNERFSEKVAGSGGIAPLLGFTIGILIFVAYRTFILKSNEFLVEIFAMLSVILFLGGVGLVDDLLGWRKGGLRKKHRIILVAFSAIPLMVINAGKSEVLIPFFGSIELGLIYPLVAIPIGIIGAATTFNHLAGFNGLEAGNGILVLLGVGLVAFFTGSSWLMVIALCMIGALFAFLFYNFYPAKVFPGDTMTLSVGGLIAIITILGNFEKVGVFFFLPFIIETLLKLKGGLKKHSFGKPKIDGTLDLRYKNIYSLSHLAILFLKKCNIKTTQKNVVYLLWTFQITIIILGFIIFRKGIFL